MTSLNSVDIAMLVVFFGSVIAGGMRGFVKEIIALLTWIAALFISITFAGRLASAFASSGTASNADASNAAPHLSMFSISVSFMVLFFATLLVGFLINYFVASLSKNQGLSFSNRFFGALFGLVRGFLVNLVMLFLVQLSPMSQQPAYAQSQVVTAYQPVIKWVNDLVAPHIEELKAKMGDPEKDVKPNSYFQLLKQDINKTGTSQ